MATLAAHLHLLAACAAAVASAGAFGPLDDGRVVHIGVLAAPSETQPGRDWLPASYIDWVQAAGAVAVPIPSGVAWNTTPANWVTYPRSPWDDATLDATFDAINGLLIPGGDPWPQVSSPAFRRLYARAVAANQAGDYFPVWGTCAGMETMVALAADGCQAAVADGGVPGGACGAAGPITRGWNATNVSLTLALTAAAAAAASRLFNCRAEGAGASACAAMVGRLRAEPLTFNYHSGGVAAEAFGPAGKGAFPRLQQMFTPLSLSTDLGGRAFVSSMEGTTLPFYGVQFHPEKVLYERGVRVAGGGGGSWPYEAINHGADAVEASQYMANFFVGEARKSRHCFPDPGAAMAASIYTHAPSAYNASSPMYTRRYYFDWESPWH